MVQYNVLFKNFSVESERSSTKIIQPAGTIYLLRLSGKNSCIPYEQYPLSTEQTVAQHNWKFMNLAI